MVPLDGRHTAMAGVEYRGLPRIFRTKQVREGTREVKNYGVCSGLDITVAKALFMVCTVASKETRHRPDGDVSFRTALYTRPAGEDRTALSRERFSTSVKSSIQWLADLVGGRG